MLAQRSASVMPLRRPGAPRTAFTPGSSAVTEDRVLHSGSPASIMTENCRVKMAIPSA
jgi:hypothetical protein